MIDSGIPDRLTTLLRDCHGVKPIKKLNAGFSGAIVFHCQSDADPISDSAGKFFAVRCWPKRTRIDRVAEVHRVMRTAREISHHVPTLVPIDRMKPNQTWLPLDDDIWELQSWKAGRPLSADASLGDIKAGARAIRQFHVATASLGITCATSTAVRQRSDRYQEVNRLLPAIRSFQLPSAGSQLAAKTIIKAKNHFVQHWSSAGPHIAAILKRWESKPRLLRWILRDVHREHLLFQDHQVTGMIDFDAVRVDSPLFDLCRWGGSFVKHDRSQDEVWKTVLAGYQEGATLTEAEATDVSIDFIADMHFCSTWLSLVNWLIWIGVERREFPAGDQAVANRVNELLQCLIYINSL